MKRALIGVLFLCGSFLSVSGISHAGQRMTVMSYNVHSCIGTDGKLDVDRIARVINAAKPDIVALQEVDNGTMRAKLANQAALLGKKTGMKYYYGGLPAPYGGFFGNAILTRLPSRNFKNHYITTYPTKVKRFGIDVPWFEPRTALTLDLTGPVPFTFVATHFDVWEERSRLMHVLDIEKYFSKAPKRPAVLAGDLNSKPGSDVMNSLRATWRIAGDRRALMTIPSGKPNRQLDYILYRPSSRWRVVEVRVVNEAVASDHRPIVAVLELMPDKP